MKIRPLSWLGVTAGTGLLSTLFSAEPPANTSSIDDQGNTYITRLVPTPSTVSPASQAKLVNPPPSILSSGASIATDMAKLK